MKSKYLRTFENYKNGYLNEEDKEIEDDIEDIVEDEIEADEAEKEENSNTEEVEIDPKAEVEEIEVEDDETPATETETSIELNISLGGMNSNTLNDLPTSTGFNPSDNFTTSPKAEWCVIKCMTNNGERLGIDKESDTDCEVICGGLHYDDAVSKVEELSRKCNCQAFDNDNDVYLGKVSKYFIKKPVKSSGGFDGMGSYK